MRRTDSQRVRAIAALAAAPTPGSLEALSRVLWDRDSRFPVRLAAFQALRATPEGDAEARRACAALLPTEPDRALVAELAATAARHGWTDSSTPLLRSLSRPWRGMADAERPEAVALTQLNPGRDLVTLAWDAVRSAPLAPDQYPGIDRQAIDAWNLLARLDPGQTRLSQLVADTRAPVAAMLRAARAALPDLPQTGEELALLVRWNRSARAAWRQAAWSALSRATDPVHPTHLRHAEPLRWIAANRPLWLDLSREQLLAGLEESLSTRHHSPRRAGLSGTLYAETLDAAAPRLSRPDLLAILALDQAVRAPEVVQALFEQARLDRADRSTEYGGLILAGSARPGEGETLGARLYPPRPAERQGDERFVASDEMLADADLALAHYHFHAQGGALDAACGPSSGDLGYARRFAVSCLVFTMLGDDRLGVDYYQPDGTVLDLGDLTRPPAPDAARTPPPPRPR